MPKPSSTHQVIRFLEHQLRIVEPGGALPTTRQIMQACRVGPHSVAKGVETLRKRHQLEVRPQSGLFRTADSDKPVKLRVDVIYFVNDAGLARIIRDNEPCDDAFHGQLAQQIRQVARERDIELAIHVADGEEGNYLLCERLANDVDVKTCMTVSLSDLSLLRILTDAHLPIVNLFPSSFALPVNTVTNDPDTVTACQLQPLLDMGHRYIAYLHNINPAYPHRDMQLRREAFYRMCLAEGLKLSSDYVCRAGYHKEEIMQAAKQVLTLDPRPSAVICADQHLPYVYEVAAELGLRIPADLSVVGTDDKQVAQEMDPPATTVRVPRRESVLIAFDLLDEVLHGRTVAEGEFIDAPVASVIRESSAPCPSC